MERRTHTSQIEASVAVQDAGESDCICTGIDKIIQNRDCVLCSGRFTFFAVAGILGLPNCFRKTAPTDTPFIKGCYCCFGYVWDDSTKSCIEPSKCKRKFGVY